MVAKKETNSAEYYEQQVLRASFTVRHIAEFIQDQKALLSNCSSYSCSCPSTLASKSCVAKAVHSRKTLLYSPGRKLQSLTR